MNTKITLTTPENVVIAAPGQVSTSQPCARFALRGLSLTIGGDDVQTVTLILQPLNGDDQPLPRAQPLRKIITGGDALAWDSVVAAALEKI
jgi:hypothetical protein